MSVFASTRRAAVGNLSAFVLLSVASVRAIADSAVRFREIRVDVSPLRASAGDPTADWVEQALPGALAQALAAHLAPGERGGPTLIARVKYVYLGPSGGGGRSRQMASIGLLSTATSAAPAFSQAAAKRATESAVCR